MLWQGGGGNEPQVDLVAIAAEPFSGPAACAFVATLIKAPDGEGENWLAAGARPATRRFKLTGARGSTFQLRRVFSGDASLDYLAISPVQFPGCFSALT